MSPLAGWAWLGLILASALLPLGSSPTAAAKADRLDAAAAARPADPDAGECAARVERECSSAGRQRPVCGSDGRTYPSKCSLLVRRCLGLAPVALDRPGPCEAGSPCLLERRGARTSGFRPVCRPDGSYHPVQCHAETGLCWCVTKDGQPIANSTIRDERPRCTGSSELISDKSAPSLRSIGTPPRPRKPMRGRQRAGGPADARLAKNACDRADRAKFNANLIDNFRIEYKRTNLSSDEKPSEKPGVEPAVNWKFTSLDRNQDGFLEKSEYRDLRRLVRKAVRPKRCARSFARSCDLNRDLKLSRHEWSACLTSDFALLKGPEDYQPPSAPPPAQHQPRPSFSEESPEPPDDTEANDCLSDQRSVLDDQRQKSQEKFYVPECTPDGRYRKVQCYSGYCWCVHQDTGKPIPGTSSKNSTPNCEPAPAPSRPMKGCPEAKKQLFLRDLMDFLAKRIQSAGEALESRYGGPGADQWQASREERIATWHFVMLDQNKNKVLERKEWKTFRNMVSDNRQLKRCGKKLPRYCDVNNDRRISMTEWLSCLNALKANNSGSNRDAVAAGTEAATSSTSKPRRMGLNPLDRFLNDDD